MTRRTAQGRSGLADAAGPAASGPEASASGASVSMASVSMASASMASASMASASMASGASVSVAWGMARSMASGSVTLAAALTAALLIVTGCIRSAPPPMEPQPPNEPPVPVGTVPPMSVPAGRHITLDVAVFFEDPDGDPLVFGAGIASALVAGVSVSGTIMTVVGVGTGITAGAIFARDTTGAEATQPFAVTVPNDPPRVVRPLPELELTPGRAETLNLGEHFTDPEGGALTYEATTANALVAGASVSGSTLIVGAVAAGRTTVTVRARDSGGATAQQQTPVTVQNP